MRRYIWTVPQTPAKACVLRMRYNISTSDYQAWDRNGKPMTDHRHNAYLNRRRRRGVSTAVDPLQYQASDLVHETSSPIMQV